MGMSLDEDYGAPKRGWVARHLAWLAVFLRLVFGLAWLADGYLKFAYNTPSTLYQFVSNAGFGQPAFLAPWFSFWTWAVSLSPQFFQYMIGCTEIMLGAFLILGFARKLTYLVGILVSLSVWAIPEGFGGPYVIGSVQIGTGIIYAMVFLALVIISSSGLDGAFTLDRVVKKLHPKWSAVSDF